MRRASTHAWNALAVLSLLLAAATVVLWVRSYSVEDIREVEQIWPLPDDPKDDGFVAYTSLLLSDRGYVQFESLVTTVRVRLIRPLRQRLTNRSGTAPRRGGTSRWATYTHGPIAASG